MCVFLECRRHKASRRVTGAHHDALSLPRHHDDQDHPTGLIDLGAPNAHNVLGRTGGELIGEPTHEYGMAKPRGSRGLINRAARVTVDRLGPTLPSPDLVPPEIRFG